MSAEGAGGIIGGLWGPQHGGKVIARLPAHLVPRVPVKQVVGDAPPSTQEANAGGSNSLKLPGIILGVFAIIAIVVIASNNLKTKQQVQLPDVPVPQAITKSPVVAELGPDHPTIRNATVRFFESGLGITPADQRSYSTTFEKASTKYINFEVKLDYDNARKDYTLTIRYRYTNARGAVVSKGSTDFQIQKSWSGSSHSIVLQLHFRKMGWERPARCTHRVRIPLGNRPSPAIR